MNTIAHLHRRKKSIQTTETLNQPLPSIITPKANVLRGELGEARSQIMLMEAKLRRLRQVREKHELSDQRNLTRIDFMNGVKQRVISDYEQKQKVRAQREESLQTLKNEAVVKREAMLAEKKRAEQQLLASKANDAEVERRRHKQHEYLIKQLKQMDTIQNEKKAQRIKQFHQTSASRLKEFKDSRIAFSKNNYHQKVAQTMQQKQKARDILEQLRQEQQKLLADVKHSQRSMMKSLYTLQTINPQHRRKIRSQRAKDEHQRSPFSLIE